MRRHWKAGLLITLAAVVYQATHVPSGESRLAQPEPQYNEKGELRRPADYRSWVFVGSSDALSYLLPHLFGQIGKNGTALGNRCLRRRRRAPFNGQRPFEIRGC